jgi:methylmalonyl-CoA/ethylmalonyl-CoA epimerase
MPYRSGIFAGLDAFGADAHLHHIGIAVKSIAAVRPDLPIVHDPTQHVRVAFFMMNDLAVELVEPADADSPILRGLQVGTQLLHTCFEVDSIDASVAQAKGAGFSAIRPATPATAFGGRRIAWVFHRQLGLVELLERARAESGAAPAPPASAALPA